MASTRPLEPGEVVRILLDGNGEHRRPPLPNRWRKVIRSGAVKDLADLLSRGPEELLALPGIGEESLAQLGRWVSSSRPVHADAEPLDVHEAEAERAVRARPYDSIRPAELASASGRLAFAARELDGLGPP